MSCDMVNRFARDPRLAQLARRLNGCEMLPYKATLFNKTSKANWLVAWHQDTALPVEEFIPDSGWSAPSIKAGRLFAQAPPSALSKILALRVHLDASTSTNGPLRVIPGSHLDGVLGDEEMKQFVRRVEPIECVVGCGGVVAMSPLIVHASSKLLSDEPRRVLHIEYAESLEIVPGIRLALA
jgi:ectoine hydroxylase-related dioxygenase (phytanoyl-CoA dioxygenase family)